MLRIATIFTALLLLATAGAAMAFSASVDPRPPAVRVGPPLVRRSRATGRIEGSVVLSPSLVSRRARFRVYAERGVGAQPPTRVDGDERRNVVVYLDTAADDALLLAGRRKHVAIRQADERFVPHVLAVVRGTTVDFPNDDVVYHNVFSLSRARTFDLGRFATRSSKAVTFPASGTVQVFCHIHSDMSAVVLVLDSPWFGMPDAHGDYAIDDVPPGDYTIVGWHERIRPIAQHVRVRAGETTRLDFDIPLPPIQAAAR